MGLLCKGKWMGNLSYNILPSEKIESDSSVYDLTTNRLWLTQVKAGAVTCSSQGTTSCERYVVESERRIQEPDRDVSLE
jgi:hypothetical protein